MEELSLSAKRLLVNQALSEAGLPSLPEMTEYQITQALLTVAPEYKLFNQEPLLGQEVKGAAKQTKKTKTSVPV